MLRERQLRRDHYKELVDNYIRARRDRPDPSWTWERKWHWESYRLYSSLHHEIYYTVPYEIRAIHMALAFVKGKPFRKVERWRYPCVPRLRDTLHPIPAIRRMGSILEERYWTQKQAIARARELLEPEQHEAFDRWVETTSVMRLF